TIIPAQATPSARCTSRGCTRCFKVKRCACATPAATPTPRVRNACASALRMRAAGRLSGRPAATRKRCACATRDCRVGPARGSPNGRALPWHTERGLPLCRPRVAHTGPDLVPEAIAEHAAARVPLLCWEG
ncbi:unnamed protein product, partial [Prorocentrum cordatum]